MKKWLPEIILGLLILFYIGFFSYLSVVRYQAFYASYYDMGIMDQTVYNTFKGRFLQLTDPEGLTNINRMTIHTDLFLALLAPFYYIYSGPETLLIIQTIIIAFGAWGLYLLGIRIIKNKWLALLFAFAYLMFTPLQRANLYDFHAISMVPTFLIFMFYFGETKRYLWSFVFAILAVLTKEEVGLTCAMYGLYTSMTSYFSVKRDFKQIKFGAIMTVFRALWIAVIYFYIIPLFGKNGAHFAMSRYSQFGTTPVNIVKNILFQPFNTLNFILDIDTLRYFWFLYGPTLFLSFLTPQIAFIPIFDFAINILSNDPNMKNIIYQYTSAITPFVFISAIYGFAKLRQKFKNINLNVVGIAILVAVMLFSMVKSPLPYSQEAELHPFLYPAANIKEINEWANKLVDDSLIISTTPRLAAHFTHHKVFYVFDERFNKSDYIVIAKSDITQRQYPYDSGIDADYLALQKSKLFERIYNVGNLEVYKKIKPLAVSETEL